MKKQDSKYRWVVFVVVLFTYFLIVSQRTAPGLITDQVMKEFNITAATIGLLTSMQFLAYAGLQVPIGVLSDRFGPNRFLILGTFLDGAGTLIYTMAPNELALIMARLLVGIGDATIWVNVVLILSRWFKVREFVGLLGVAGMSGSLGFVLATVPFSAWIAAAGWRIPFSTVGAILCVLSVVLYYVLEKKPKELFQETSENKRKRKSKEREPTRLLLRRIFTDRQAWATFLCHFGAVGTYVGFIGSWAVPFGMHVYGLSRSSSSQLIMIGLVGALIGAPLTSWIAGRLNSLKRPYVMVHILLVLSWSVFLVFNGKPPLYLLYILFFLIGYGNGASSLTFAVVRQSFPLKEVGVVSGFANTGGFLSAVLLPSIFGKVLDHFDSGSSIAGYHYGFMIPVVFTVIGLIGGILIHQRKHEENQLTDVTS